MRGRELYSFIPWWVFVIDAHAVLTGGGDGLYAESLLRDNLLPETLPPVQHIALPPISSSGASQISVLQFHRKMYIHATELGLLARNFRRQHAETALRGNAPASDEMEQLALKARENLERTWETHYPDFKIRGYTNDQVALKDRGIFEHVRSFTLASHRVKSFYLRQKLLRTNLVAGLDHYSLFRFNHLLLYKHVANPDIHQLFTSSCRNLCSLNLIPQPRRRHRRPCRAQIHRLPTLHGRHPLLPMFFFRICRPSSRNSQATQGSRKENHG